MLTGADSRKIATPRIAPASQLAHSRSGDMREVVTERWRRLSAFCSFGLNREALARPCEENSARKSGKRTSPVMAEHFSTLLHGHYSRTVSPNQTISGREGAVKARSNPPCILPAQPKASVFIEIWRGLFPQNYSFLFSDSFISGEDILSPDREKAYTTLLNTLQECSVLLTSVIADDRIQVFFN